MTTENVLLFLVLIFCFLNLFILFYVSGFLVKFRSDVFDYLAATTDTEPKIIPQKNKTIESNSNERTWDQKYEDELEIISKRIRQRADGDI